MILELILSSVLFACIACTVWYECLKPMTKTKTQTQVPICWKCKYCIKKNWLLGGTRIQCRTPNDPTPISYLTGVKSYPEYNCFDRNSRGTCVSFKKVWWRR